MAGYETTGCLETPDASKKQMHDAHVEMRKALAKMSHDESAVGLAGVLTVATRGAHGLGEVLLRIRGGTETYLARSDQPLARGTKVLVVEAHGARKVTVVPWQDPLDEFNVTPPENFY